MKTFSIDITRTATSVACMQVQAKTRQAAQEKALDMAGDHTFNERDAQYALDSNSCDNEDRFTGLKPSSLVLNVFSSNNGLDSPGYVTVPITEQIARLIESGMALVSQNNLAQITQVMPIQAEWGMHYMQTEWGARVAKFQEYDKFTGPIFLEISGNRFFVSTRSCEADLELQSCEVSHKVLMAHIDSGAEQTVYCDANPELEKEIKELLSLLASETTESDNNNDSNRESTPVG